MTPRTRLNTPTKISSTARGADGAALYARKDVRQNHPARAECLGKLVLLGENHLRTDVREYVAHYQTERNHQCLEGRLIEPPADDAGAGPIVCRERLGGLLRFYDREAA